MSAADRLASQLSSSSPYPILWVLHEPLKTCCSCVCSLDMYEPHTQNTYRSVPFRFVHYIQPKVEGGLYLNMQLVSSVTPPQVYASAAYTSKVHVYVYKNTVTKAFYTKQLIQDREYCSWTSRLQSFMVSLHRRRAASSTRGQEHSRRLRCSCPQEQQYCL